MLAVGLAALVAGRRPVGRRLGRRPRAAGPPVRDGPLGVVALLASGVLVATSSGLAPGGPGLWADATAALGLGLLLAQVVRVRRPRIAGWRGWRIR